MNDALLRNWNETIKPNDEVYFLGDLALGKLRTKPNRCSLEIAKRWANQLNGKIVWIQGNHDPVGWGENSVRIKFDDLDFDLVHNPSNIAHLNSWLIHAHVHNSNTEAFPFINFKKKTINISVDMTNFKPVNLDLLMDYINHNSINIEYYDDNTFG